LGLGLIGVLVVSGSAGAEEKGPLTTRTVEIVGRLPRPTAAVEVSRARAKVAVSELRQPFVEGAEAATRRDPF